MTQAVDRARKSLDVETLERHVKWLEQDIQRLRDRIQDLESNLLKVALAVTF